MRIRRSSQRGFTLIIVVIVMALLALVGMIVLDVLNLDARMIGSRRLAQEAQEVAEGALGEVVDDRMLNSMLPSPSEDNLVANYTPSDDTLFSGDMTETQSKHEFSATVSMVRAIPVQESSLNVLRAFMYEVRVDSKVNGGDANDTAEAAIYKLFSHKAGTVLPEVHAR